MKIIAFYLPQYYTFPENDEWWGAGFTEWSNVKKAIPLYKGHYQPTEPFAGNYYCLEDPNVFTWQISLAKKYGIFGFCFYHYWMGEGRQLMQKPVEMYLENKDYDLPFCLCWANHNWARTWVGGDTDILMDVRYGREPEWENHFQYLLPYFKDKRYIQIEGKPLLVLYQPEKIPCLNEMLDYFQKRANENGLLGITVISQAQTFLYSDQKDNNHISYSILYEPDYTRKEYLGNRFKIASEAFRKAPRFTINMIFDSAKKMINKVIPNRKLQLTVYDYDGLWNRILSRKVENSRLIPAAFVTYDTSPRKGYRGTVTKGYTPEKFGGYFRNYLDKCKNEFNKDIMFIMAWNEWGEGAYLEPDNKYGYAVLEQIKYALDSFVKE